MARQPSGNRSGASRPRPRLLGWIEEQPQRPKRRQKQDWWFEPAAKAQGGPYTEEPALSCPKKC